MIDSIHLTIRSRLMALLFGTAALMLAVTCAVPAHEKNQADVAMAGYDPVAYFTMNKAAKGQSQFAATHAGVTWHFANAKHKKLFTANPAKYAPQYGGHCAWAMAAKNEFYPTDPNIFAIVNGKLYLNYNKDVSGMWNKDRAGFIKTANKNWAKSDQPISTKING